MAHTIVAAGTTVTFSITFAAATAGIQPRREPRARPRIVGALPQRVGHLFGQV